MNFFRLQDAGITFEQMMDFNSANGGDGMEDEELSGLCVSDTPDSFGGAEGAYGSGRPGEVVILKGYGSRIYDGCRIQPTKEVARFSWDAWMAKIADGRRGITKIGPDPTPHRAGIANRPTGDNDGHKGHCYTD